MAGRLIMRKSVDNKIESDCPVCKSKKINLFMKERLKLHKKKTTKKNGLKESSCYLNLLILVMIKIEL